MTNYLVESIKQLYEEFDKKCDKLTKAEKTKAIEKMFGVQATFTPVDELAKYFDFKAELKDKQTIAILYNPEFLEYFLRDFNYINSKKFVFFYDSKADRFTALNIMTQYKYNNVELISIENNNLEEQIMPKHFDVVFTNPPYNNNIDLDLIENLLDNNITEKVVAVHPGKFLFNHNAKGDGYSLKNSGYLTKVILGWYNKFFKTHMVGIHCISIWKKNNTSKTIEIDYAGVISDWEKKDGMKKYLSENTFITDINEITIHPCFRKEAAQQLKQNLSRTSIKDLLCKLEAKEIIDPKTGKVVLNSKGKPKMVYYPINPTHYGLIIPPTRPGIEGWDKRDYDTFFSPFGKDIDYFIDETFVWDKTTPSQCGAIYFDTEEERKNAWDYLRLKNTRWNVSLIKPSSNMVQGNILCGIPIPKEGFKKHYSEQDVCEENKISKELWDYIDTLFSSTYYEDYEEFSK